MTTISLGPGLLGVLGLTVPSADYVRLASLDQPALALTAELGPDAIVPTGFPTWDLVQVPTATTTAGAPPLAMTIPLVFDKWRTQGSIEPELAMLDRLAGLGLQTAPTLVIVGNAVPHSFGRDPFRRWACNGDPAHTDVRRRADGDRCLALVSINVVEVVLAPVMPDPAAPVRVTFVVPSGGIVDTTRRIAIAHRTTSQALLILNPTLSSDVDRHLKAGTRVRVS